MIRKLAVLSCVAALVMTSSVFFKSEAQTTPTEAIDHRGDVSARRPYTRGPETMEWSPDGTKLSFVQRDDKGEKGELWYVDAATGEKKILVSAAKLASLRYRRQQGQERRRRAPYALSRSGVHLAPDSKHLMFDSQGQLWYYDLASETAVQFTSASDPSGDPKFSPDGNRVAYVRKHNLYVRPISGKDEKQLTHDTGEDLARMETLTGVYAEELGVAQQLLLGSPRRQADRIPPHG